MRRLLFLKRHQGVRGPRREAEGFAARERSSNVSAAAVSRMVHLLEQRLGVALFERKANTGDDIRRPRLQSGLTHLDATGQA